MRALRLVCVGLVMACVGGAAPTVTPIATTAPPPSTTTIALAPSFEVEATGCSAPPVTFALLCQVVELIDERHYSPPPHSALAAGAQAGVSLFTSQEIEDLPSTLSCAVPSPEFNPFCEMVEDRLRRDPVPVTQLVEVAVEQMLAQALDPYTTYVRPELAGSLNENGVIGGVGIVVAARNSVGSPCVLIGPTCPLVIDVVIEGGPGDQAGLLPGDQIIAVAGEDVAGQGVAEVATALSGAAGETTELLIARQGQELSLPLVHQDQDVVPVLVEVVGNTGYMRLPEFGLDTHLFVHFMLDGMIDSGIDRLILDLRDNPGGFLFSVSIIGSEFVRDGLLYRTFSPQEEREYPAVEGGVATRIPMMVLVNELSASSAEILAAALQERNRATIVGRPTYGKNLVQETFELRNGGLLRLTTAEWTTPAGASVAPAGVQPDINLDWPEDIAIPDLVAMVEAATR